MIKSVQLYCDLKNKHREINNLQWHVLLQISEIETISKRLQSQQVLSLFLARSG